MEPETVKAEREMIWEERLVALAQAARIELNKMPARKSHPDKVRLAAALKRSTSAGNVWLSQRLGMGRPASASQFVRRYLLAEHGLAETQELLSRVKT